MHICKVLLLLLWLHLICISTAKIDVKNSYSSSTAGMNSLHEEKSTNSKFSWNQYISSPFITAAATASAMKSSDSGIILCIQIFFRSLYLLFLFIPAITLSPIAYFSIGFRSAVWFPLLQTSIAHSGAVSDLIFKFYHFYSFRIAGFHKMGTMGVESTRYLLRKAL